MSVVLVWLIYIVLLWIVIGMPMGALLGKMIKRADREERTFAGGVVARAIRAATEDPPPDRYAAMDEHIGVLGHDAVLQWISPDVVDDFNGKNEERARQAELHERAKKAKREYYERRIAKAVDPVQEKRRITAEIMGYSHGGPIRTYDDEDFVQARRMTQEALALQRRAGQLAGNSDRW